VLDDDLIRVQMLPDGRPRFPRTWTVVGQEGMCRTKAVCEMTFRRFHCRPFSTAQDGSIQLQTRNLRLEISLGDFAINWFDASGNAMASDLAGRAYATTAPAPVYGIIWNIARASTISALASAAESWTRPAGGCACSIWMPLTMTQKRPIRCTSIFRSTSPSSPARKSAYGLFYDNLATSVFEMGGELDAYHGRYRYYQAEHGDIDYYLIYGPSIEQVVEKFSALIGRPVLPPRWSLGYLGSTMAYTEAPDAQAQLKRFAELCEQHQIPCDLFHLSSGYTMDENEKRNVFTWDRSRIPDPEGMVESFARGGIQLTANIKPALLLSHPRYAEVAAFDGFIKQASSEAPEIVAFWGGQGFVSRFHQSANLRVVEAKRAPAAFRVWHRFDLE
jgi:alpha-glucosidase